MFVKWVYLLRSVLCEKSYRRSKQAYISCTELTGCWYTSSRQGKGRSRNHSIQGTLFPPLIQKLFNIFWSSKKQYLDYHLQFGDFLNSSSCGNLNPFKILMQKYFLHRFLGLDSYSHSKPPRTHFWFCVNLETI